MTGRNISFHTLPTASLDLTSLLFASKAFYRLTASSGDDMQQLQNGVSSSGTVGTSKYRCAERVPSYSILCYMRCHDCSMHFNLVSFPALSYLFDSLQVTSRPHGTLDSIRLHVATRTRFAAASFILSPCLRLCRHFNLCSALLFRFALSPD